MQTAGDSYGYDKASKPTTPTTSLAPTQSLDVSQLLKTGMGNYATRRQVTPVQADCFDPVDWYDLDVNINIPPDDWNTLQVVYLNWPNSKEYAAAPAAQVVDRVCVQGCDGTFADDCILPAVDCPWWPWAVLLAATNIATAVLVYCCCMPTPSKRRYKEVEKVIYTDGTVMPVTTHVAQRGEEEEEEHTYLFGNQCRDMLMGGDKEDSDHGDHGDHRHGIHQPRRV